MDSQAIWAAFLGYATIVFDNTGALLFQPGHFLSLAPLGAALLIAIAVLGYLRTANRTH